MAWAQTPGRLGLQRLQLAAAGGGRSLKGCTLGVIPACEAAGWDITDLEDSSGTSSSNCAYREGAKFQPFETKLLNFVTSQVQVQAQPLSAHLSDAYFTLESNEGVGNSKAIYSRHLSHALDLITRIGYIHALIASRKAHNKSYCTHSRARTHTHTRA
eukprot:scaffold312386_cov17-Tisochrysis_lutea.AAC.1